MADGGVASGFSGTVHLWVASGPGQDTPVISEVHLAGERVEFTNPGPLPVDMSGWRLDVFAAVTWPEPTAAYVMPEDTIVPAGGVFEVIASGNSPGSYPAFFTQNRFLWQFHAPNDPAAAMLRTREGEIIDLVCIEGSDPSQIPAPGAGESWIGETLPRNTFSSRSYQRVGNLNHRNRGDWVVTTATPGQLNASLRLPFAAARHLEPLVPETVTLENGVWSGLVRVEQAGTALVLRADDGNGLSGDSNPFDVAALPALTLAVPQEAFEDTPGPVGPANVIIPQSLATNLQVSLFSDDPSQFTVTSAVIIPAGSTSAVFDIENFDDSLLDGSRSVRLTATAPGFSTASAIILNHDNETATLSLELPATVPESAGVLLRQGRIMVDRPVEAAVRVKLSSEEPARLAVPPFVILEEGNDSATFDVIVIENTAIEGTRIVSVHATVENWNSAMAQIAVLDNEDTVLALSGSPVLIEGTGELTDDFSISIQGTLPTNLVVNLFSDDPASLALPPSVTIPAGQTHAAFPVTLPDDMETDGARIVTLTAEAGDFQGTVREVTVRDNDLHHFSFAALPPAQVAGKSFQATIEARSIDEMILGGFIGSVSLNAVGLDTTLAPSPGMTTGFSNGVWSGTLVIPVENRETRLIASTPDGVTGTSGPFDVVDAFVPELRVSDLVFHEPTGTLLAGVLGTSPQFPQTIVFLDPESGQATDPVALNDEPGRLALSDDGRFLYVGLMTTGGVARVDLSSRAVDMRFPLGEDPLHGFGSFFVEDMVVMPGSPDTLVISRRVAFNHYNYGVAVYQAGVALPDVVGPAEFANGYYLTAYDSPVNLYSTYVDGLRRLKVSSSGVQLIQEFRGPQYGGIFMFDSGLLYSTSGEVFTTVQHRRVGEFAGSGLVLPNASAGRIAFLDQPRLSIHDIHSFEALGTLTLPGIQGTADRLVKCGPGRLALRTSTGQVFIVRTGLFPPFALADLSVSQTSVTDPVVVGQDLVYSITVSNAGPATADNVILVDLIPLDASFVRTTVEEQFQSFRDGILSIRLGAVPPGTAETVAVTVQPTNPGVLINEARALGGTVNVSNNTSFWTNIARFGPQRPHITELQINAVDLAYDKNLNLLYAGINEQDGEVVNGILPIDIGSGVQGEIISVGEGISLIAVDDSGSSLFAALEGLAPHTVTPKEILQLNAQTGTVQNRFGIQDTFGPSDISGVPGHPSALLIARNGQQDDVVLYENGTLTRRSPLDLHCTGLEPGGIVGRFFGVANTPFRTLVTLQIEGDRIDIVNSVENLLHPNDPVTYVDGRLFATSGKVIDADSLILQGRLPLTIHKKPAAHDGKLFALRHDEVRWYLSAFDQVTLAPLWSYRLPLGIGSPEQLLSCGTPVLCVRTTGGKVLLLNTEALPNEPLADLEVTTRVLTPLPQPDEPALFHITVSNRGPAHATSVLLTNLIPSNVLLDAVTLSQGNYTNVDDQILCFLDDLAPFAVASVELTLTLDAPGALRIAPGATALEQDPDPRNNVAPGGVYFPSPQDRGVRVLLLNAADLAYDSARGRLYASLPSVSEAFGSVVSIDTQSGMFGTPVQAGAGPNHLAVSRDGTYLYVGLDSEFAVQRFHLDQFTPDLRFNLGAGMRAADLEVLPFSPGSIAVSRSRNMGSPRHAGVGVYDNGVLRPGTTSSSSFANRIASGESSGLLYAYDNESSAFNLSYLELDVNGVSVAKAIPGLISGFGVDIEFAGSRLYSTSGAVIDPVTESVVGRFEGPGLGLFTGEGFGTLVEPDLENNRVYFLVQDGPLWKLNAYDASTFDLVGSLSLPALSGIPSSLIKTHADGLAFRTSEGQIFLCSRSAVRAIDLNLSQSVAPEVITQGGTLTYTVTVRNPGVIDADSLEVFNVLPEHAPLISAVPTTGDWVVNNSVISWTIQTLPAGAEEKLTIVVQPAFPGLVRNQAWVESPDVDLDPSDNASVLHTPVRQSSLQQTNLLKDLHFPAAHLAYDVTRSQILAGTMSGSKALLYHDLDSAGSGVIAPLGSDSGRLAISDDGHFLYAALATGGVARVDLDAHTVDLRFSLGATEPNSLLFAGDLEVMPGIPTTLAVSHSFFYLEGPNTEVVLYDNGVPYSEAVPAREFGGVYPIEFSDSGVLYSTLPFYLRVLAIGPEGLALETELLDLVPQYDAEFEQDGGFAFFEQGRVVDLESLSVIGQFPVSGKVAPDKVEDRVCFLTRSGTPFTGPLLHLRNFDLKTFSEFWSIPVPQGAGEPLSLIRLGTEGFAFSTTSNRLFVVRNDALATPSADLSVSLSGTPNPVTHHARLTLTCIVSNQGPWTATNVVLTNLLPAGTAVLSATASQGDISQSGDSVICNLGTLLSGTSTLVTLTVSPAALDPFTATSAVSWPGADPFPTNNSAEIVIQVSPQPTILVADATFPEGNSGSSLKIFEAILSHPASDPVSVNIQTIDGTASAGSDYDATAGTILFQPGITRRTFTIRVHGDTQIEPDEDFLVVFSSPTNAVLGVSQAVGTILNDDVHTLSVSGTSLPEGNEGITYALFTITLSEPSSVPVRVGYLTANGTAEAGRDFQTRAGTLLFQPGQTTRTVHVPVIGNHLQEPNKTFHLLLHDPHEARLATNEAMATIVNDDVESPLVITTILLEPGIIRIRFVTTPGRLYVVERSRSLHPGDWSEIASTYAETGESEVADSIEASDSQAYYRIVREP